MEQQLKPELENLISQTKESLKDNKRVSLSQAWKILQLVVANVVQSIEIKCISLIGQDKKELALDFINKFYDAVFVIIDVPFVPNALESIIHRYIKKILMIMVSSSIDATVTIFKNVGVFKQGDKI